MVVSDDGHTRCRWCGTGPLYVAYHDDEWGRPVTDADRLFEKICLEGFQSGLAWITVLRKREHYRKAFADFDVRKVARFDAKKVEKALASSPGGDALRSAAADGMQRLGLGDADNERHAEAT